MNDFNEYKKIWTYGVMPHDTIPTTTSFGAEPWTMGPPESPLQADIPPVIGPVQILVSSTKAPFSPKLKIALRQSFKLMIGMIAFCKMLGRVWPPVEPHPDKTPGPEGIAWACGIRAGRIRSLKVNGTCKRISAKSSGPTPPATQSGWMIERGRSISDETWDPSTAARLCLPEWMTIRPKVGVSVMQWAAVKIQTAFKIVPPHTWVDTPNTVHWRLTINGNSPGIALTPPTMKGSVSIAGAANTAVKANDNKIKVFIALNRNLIQLSERKMFNLFL